MTRPDARSVVRKLTSAGGSRNGEPSRSGGIPPQALQPEAVAQERRPGVVDPLGCDAPDRLRRERGVQPTARRLDALPRHEHVERTGTVSPKRTPRGKRGVRLDALHPGSCGSRAQQRTDEQRHPASATATPHARPGASQPTLWQEPRRRPVQERVRIPSGSACGGRSGRSRAPRSRRRCPPASPRARTAPARLLAESRTSSTRPSTGRRAAGRAPTATGKLASHVGSWTTTGRRPSPARTRSARPFREPGRGSRRARRESCPAAAPGRGRAARGRRRACLAPR